MWFRIVLIGPFSVSANFRQTRSLGDRMTAAGGEFAKRAPIVQNKVTNWLQFIALRKHCYPMATMLGALQRRTGIRCGCGATCARLSLGSDEK
jgi:hypothetical protein